MAEHNRYCAVNDAQASEPRPCNCGAIPRPQGNFMWDGNTWIPKKPTDLVSDERLSEILTARWSDGTHAHGAEIESCLLELQRLRSSGGAPGDPPERLLRVMLAHAYSGANLYGDDGELQDNSAQPFIDYLRDDPWQIQHAIHKRGMQKLEAAAKSPGEPSERQPDGYAYRYPDGYIRFSGGREVNGSDPVETIPYYFRRAPEPRDEPLPPCSTCGGETVPFCTSCGYTTTKPAEYPAYTECQHDHMKPNPTLRATYPKHGSQSGWVQEYRCNVCQCSFERPIATAGLRANGETP